MLLPILIIQTRKFAALNTLGSAFFVVRFFEVFNIIFSL